MNNKVTATGVYDPESNKVVDAHGYSMSDKKADKVERVKGFFDSKGIFYDEKGNGQLTFDSKINLWATTEKWHDTSNNQTGVGINSLLKHMVSQDIL